MMSHRSKFSSTIVFSAILLLAGCVSVDTLLAPPTPKKADAIVYSAPKNDFKEIKNSTVDMAWQNSKNGNTIAFLSECGTKTDSSLKSLETENLAAMTNVEMIDSKNADYNDREALMSTVSGQVDGVEVKLRLVIFKKNGCNFTLSYVGRKKNFEKNEKVFKSFVEDFKAP